jgi:hypothetical protein
MIKFSIQKTLIVFSAVLIFVLAGGFILVKNKTQKPIYSMTGVGMIEQVSAEEIYPLFECPCCGKSIAAECCGMARERKTYIDGLVEGKLSKDEAIMAYIKKYGLDSFVDKAKQEEFRKKLSRQAPADRPIIVVSPLSKDLGNISRQKGIVVVFFKIENKGKSDLVINKLETSCGCTSASIVYQGLEGPKFSMDMGQKIPDWQIVIPAGEAAQLKVYYDPNFHKDFQGYALREIYIYSNDPIDFQKKVQIEFNQIN